MNDTFNIEEVNESPGFVRLASATPVVESSILSLCQNVNGHCYLSSRTVRSNILQIVEVSSESQLPASYIFGVFKHPVITDIEEIGPAVKLLTYPLGQAWYWNDDQRIVAFEGDIVFGIHCQQTWPACASKWCTRPRLWPPADVVKEIINSGFIIVPKPSHKGTDEDDEVEWHISFPH